MARALSLNSDRRDSQALNLEEQVVSEKGSVEIYDPDAIVIAEEDDDSDDEDEDDGSFTFGRGLISNIESLGKTIVDSTMFGKKEVSMSRVSTDKIKTGHVFRRVGISPTPNISQT